MIRREENQQITFLDFTLFENDKNELVYATHFQLSTKLRNIGKKLVMALHLKNLPIEMSVFFTHSVISQCNMKSCTFTGSGKIQGILERGYRAYAIQSLLKAIKSIESFVFYRI